MKVFEVRRRCPTRSGLAVLFWWTMVPSFLRGVFKLAYRMRWEGTSNVPHRGPIIYAANHQSHLDPPLVGCVVADRPFASLGRASLFSFAPFGWLLRQVGTIPLRRGQGGGGAGALRIAIGVIQAGGGVLIFPEGTRSPDGALGLFEPGMLALLRRASAQVVPVAIEGAFDVWRIGRSYPRLRGRIAVKIGEPFAAAELLNLSPEAAMDRLRRRIETMRLELRGQLRKASRGRYPAPGPGDLPFWEPQSE